MVLTLLFVFVILLIVFFFYIFANRNDAVEPQTVVEPPGECCGAHSVCDEDTLLSSSNRIVYYDDEELDSLAGVSPDGFSNEQLKALSDVFYSLKENDTAGWLRSLHLRNIELPAELREQALLIVAERRTV